MASPEWLIPFSWLMNPSYQPPTEEDPPSSHSHQPEPFGNTFPPQSMVAGATSVERTNRGDQKGGWKRQEGTGRRRKPGLELECILTYWIYYYDTCVYNFIYVYIYIYTHKGNLPKNTDNWWHIIFFPNYHWNIYQTVAMTFAGWGFKNEDDITIY